MKKFAFAVAMVLAMAGPSFAVFSYSVEPVAGFDSPVLDAYLVRLGGVRTFADFDIWADLNGAPNLDVLGLVHQVNEFNGFTSKAQETLWLGMMSPESERYDTHFMFAYDAPHLEIGNVAVETNTKNTSPTGIYQDEYGFYYGLGTFSCEEKSGFTFPNDLPPDTPFMQIVVPKGSSVWLTGTVVINHDVRFSLFIPEPGTVAMLIAGALCLVAFRFRRR